MFWPKIVLDPHFSFLPPNYSHNETEGIVTTEDLHQQRSNKRPSVHTTTTTYSTI